jgi:DNA-binding SARP family transcriptional activator
MIFRVLGPLEVAIESTPAIRGVRRRTLLGTLLLHPNQHLSLGKLCAAVWGDDRPPSTVANLRTYMSEIRKLLRRAGAGDEGLRSLQGGDHRAAADQMRQALWLWRGKPLADLGTDLPAMLSTRVTRLEEQRRDLRVRWTDTMLELGYSDELVPILREISQNCPLHEHAWGNLAIALSRAGRTAEALSTITEINRTLVTELGAEPGPELRDIQRALLHGTTPSSHPPVRQQAAGRLVLCPTPQQLPFHSRRLVGRDDLVADIATSSGPELICLNGPPGVGKSVVAIEAAHRADGQFPDGRLYVDLGGSSGEPLATDDAVGLLLSGFGLDADSLPNGPEARRALYFSLVSRRRLVVVLDNAESTEQVAPLVPGDGGNLVLITSRVRLPELSPHRRYDVSPLTHAQSAALLSDIAGEARTAAEPQATADLADSCAGLPLAVRIIGERLATRPDLSVAAAAAQLHGEDVLDRFSIGALDLRARIEHSYRRLDAESRRWLRRLVTYLGVPITAAGLAAAWSVSETAAGQALENLTQNGLLILHTTASGAAAGFALPRPLQAFAAEMSHADPTEADWRRPQNSRST